MTRRDKKPWKGSKQHKNLMDLKANSKTLKLLLHFSLHTVVWLGTYIDIYDGITLIYVSASHISHDLNIFCSIPQVRRAATRQDHVKIKFICQSPTVAFIQPQDWRQIHGFRGIHISEWSWEVKYCFKNPINLLNHVLSEIPSSSN